MLVVVGKTPNPCAAASTEGSCTRAIKRSAQAGSLAAPPVPAPRPPFRAAPPAGRARPPLPRFRAWPRPAAPHHSPTHPARAQEAQVCAAEAGGGGFGRHAKGGSSGRPAWRWHQPPLRVRAAPTCPTATEHNSNSHGVQQQQQPSASLATNLGEHVALAPPAGDEQDLHPLRPLHARLKAHRDGAAGQVGAWSAGLVRQEGAQWQAWQESIQVGAQWQMWQGSIQARAPAVPATARKAVGGRRPAGSEAAPRREATTVRVLTQRPGARPRLQSAGSRALCVTLWAQARPAGCAASRRGVPLRRAAAAAGRLAAQALRTGCGPRSTLLTLPRPCSLRAGAQRALRATGMGWQAQASKVRAVGQPRGLRADSCSVCCRRGSSSGSCGRLLSGAVQLACMNSQVEPARSIRRASLCGPPETTCSAQRAPWAAPLPSPGHPRCPAARFALRSVPASYQQ